MGDKSDEISGVGGIGEKYAKELLTAYGSVNSFLLEYKSLDDKARKKIKKVFRDFAEGNINKNGECPWTVFQRNRELMDMRMAPDLGSAMVKTPQRNPGEFRELCQTLGFNSILDDFDNWVRPFTMWSST
jgi:5'-3' exonuclease